ncbi:MAG: S26 family signal peptidase [Polyangiaceae bacterium]
MRSFFRGVAWLLGILAVLALILYATVFDVWVVPSDDPSFTASILPTLAPGDILLVTRHGSAPSFETLEKCADPDAPGRFVVARVAGVAGDKIEISKDGFRRNGQALSIGSTGCDTRTVDVENPTSHEVVSLSCNRTDAAGLSHGILRGTADFENDVAATVDPNRIYLLSDDLHFHQDSRDYGQIEPGTCQHIVFRLFGALGITDGSRRFALLW